MSNITPRADSRYIRCSANPLPLSLLGRSAAMAVAASLGILWPVHAATLSDRSDDFRQRDGDEAIGVRQDTPEFSSLGVRVLGQAPNIESPSSVAGAVRPSMPPNVGFRSEDASVPIQSGSFQPGAQLGQGGQAVSPNLDSLNAAAIGGNLSGVDFNRVNAPVVVDHLAIAKIAPPQTASEALGAVMKSGTTDTQVLGQFTVTPSSYAKQMAETGYNLMPGGYVFTESDLKASSYEVSGETGKTATGVNYTIVRNFDAQGNPTGSQVNFKTGGDSGVIVSYDAQGNAGGSWSYDDSERWRKPATLALSMVAATVGAPQLGTLLSGGALAAGSTSAAMLGGGVLGASVGAVAGLEGRQLLAATTLGVTGGWMGSVASDAAAFVREAVGPGTIGDMAGSAVSKAASAAPGALSSGNARSVVVSAISGALSHMASENVQSLAQDSGLVSSDDLGAVRESLKDASKALGVVNKTKSSLSAYEGQTSEVAAAARSAASSEVSSAIAMVRQPATYMHDMRLVAASLGTGQAVDGYAANVPLASDRVTGVVALGSVTQTAQATAAAEASPGVSSVKGGSGSGCPAGFEWVVIDGLARCLASGR